MTGFLERHSGNALLASIIGSVTAIAIAGLSAYFSYDISVTAQDKTVRLEALARFDQSNAGIIQSAGEFIAALNSSKDLSSAKEKIKTLAAQQIGETEDLRKFFPNDQVMTKYQDALTRFSTVAQNTSDVTEMRQWVETFGDVVDYKNLLARDLYKKLGVNI